MSTETILNQYRIEPLMLGQGGFAEVFLAIDLNTNRKIAAKKISLLKKDVNPEKFVSKIFQEIELMKIMNHPNIVTFYNSFQTATYVYIFLEYCDAGHLGHVIDYFDEQAKADAITITARESDTFYYLDQLKNALNYIRRMGYTHRDIKPMNVLLTRTYGGLASSIDTNISDIFTCDDDTRPPPSFVETINKSELLSQPELITLKLADFGLAKGCSNETSMMTTICGSPLYMAPELLLENCYTIKADLWSIGIIMYQLLFGNHPVNALNLPQLIANLRSKYIDFQIQTDYTFPCFDLLTGLLNDNHRVRIDWPEFFEHQWFSIQRLRRYGNEGTVENRTSTNNSRGSWDTSITDDPFVISTERAILNSSRTRGSSGLSRMKVLPYTQARNIYESQDHRKPVPIMSRSQNQFRNSINGQSRPLQPSNTSLKQDSVKYSFVKNNDRDKCLKTFSREFFHAEHEIQRNHSSHPILPLPVERNDFAVNVKPTVDISRLIIADYKS